MPGKFFNGNDNYLSMSTCLSFRNTFSTRLRSGKRSKYLNKRTASIPSDSSLPPVIVVDLDYIEFLFYSRLSSVNSLLSKEKISKEKLLYKWLLSVFSLIPPGGIIFTSSKETDFSVTLPFEVKICNIKNFLYSVRRGFLLENPLAVLSNNMELWVLASSSSSMSFIAIDNNNRIIHYKDKTGLDILSKFIGTYKAINKLRLSHIKYVNLQYVFLLIYYVKITYSKKKDFYFDGLFFSEVKSKKPFYKSKGLGLDLITEAHKFLSYALLTKPEFLDFFLLHDCQDFELHLKRLLKIIDFDVTVLTAMKIKYDSEIRPRLLKTVSIPNICPTLPNEFKYYNMIWSESNHTTNMTELKALVKLAKRYDSLYGSDMETLASELPPGYRNEFSKRKRNISANLDDTNVESYVNSLFEGLNGNS